MISRQLPLLVLLVAGASTASLAADPARYMSAELIAESVSPAPGSTITVGLRLRPKPGWHGYWSNPGDAGFAPTIVWGAPAGVAFGPLLHPAPKLISAAGLSSYVHEGEHMLLSRLTVPRGLAPGTPIPVTAKANWAACTATMCVPLKASFTLDLVAGNGAKGPASAAIAAAGRKLPKPASGGTFSSEGRTVRLALPATARLDPRRTRFFPDDNDAFRTASGRTEAGSQGLAITGTGEKSTDSLSGVASDGRAAYRLTLIRKEPEAEAAKPGPVADTQAAPPRPAPPPAPEPVKGDGDPARGKAPEQGLWVGLLIAAALAAGAFLLLRRRTS